MTTTFADMLARLERCEDPARLEHYADEANVREWNDDRGGTHSWCVLVMGAQGRCFRLVSSNPAGMREGEARSWAYAVRSKAGERLAAMLQPA
ncbi:hypothetical protein [Tautonia rosea]|uniref:hypothetical protein n=1 Tax=Tautonia rosea TaxID=2728037 RepID=UPI001475B091|nr:hypothetical protein [Tautonia rosea]